jgi:SAM-dependent methyltransferase
LRSVPIDARVTEALPFEDDSFDLVTGFNSFFLAGDITAALREAGRVAKPGAAVVIQVWGDPANCELIAVLRALTPLRPERPARSRRSASRGRSRFAGRSSTAPRRSVATTAVTASTTNGTS